MTPLAEQATDARAAASGAWVEGFYIGQAWRDRLARTRRGGDGDG